VSDLVVGRWGARFRGRRFACALGRGGIGVKRAEGDGVTPLGRHRVEAVLVRKDRAKSVGSASGSRRLSVATKVDGALPIGPRDGWSDDPADPAYNRRVRRPHPWRHEALRRADRQYDLVAVLDWNRHPPVPGRGSAIFLHVWRRPRHPTGGCIAFARADLAWILERWGRRSRVIVR
jgi:L,D-peptidoglycan transpeptidase YkuD (ErfK/YbiS/YcfS/YnhG family)